MYQKPNSVIGSVASAAESIRNQRSEGIASFDRKGAQVSAWLREMIEIYKAQIKDMAPSAEVGSVSSDSLPDDVISWIDSLKKKELQHELRCRDWNPNGLKDDLRERLIQSMIGERDANKSTANGPVDERDDEAMDISVEKQADYVEVFDPMRDSEMNHEKPCDTKSERNLLEVGFQATMKTASKEIAAKREILAQEGLAKPQPEQQSVMDISPKKCASNEAQKESSGAPDEITVDTEMHQMTSPSKFRLPFQRTQSGTQSTLKNRMQASLQSALKNLRPISPKREVEPTKSPPKPKKQIVVLPETISIDESESSAAASKPESAISVPTVPLPVVPVPGDSRPLATPAVTSKMGNLGIHSSNSTQAKNDARMARLAEMRNKSKPIASVSVNKIQNPAILPGLKSSSTLNNNSSNNKRQFLTNQMREKAFGRLGEPLSVVPTNSQVGPPPSSATSSGSDSSQSEVVLPKKAMTPPQSLNEARSPVLSPLDTYEMSDHGGSSDTDEEEERARRVGKRVPHWAQKENLKQALHRQYTDNTVDPDDMFGEVTTCNLEAIFGRKKTKYQKRTSSGNWTKDRATVAEKLAFKRQMGYAVEA